MYWIHELKNLSPLSYSHWDLPILLSAWYILDREVDLLPPSIAEGSKVWNLLLFCTSYGEMIKHDENQTLGFIQKAHEVHKCWDKRDNIGIK